MLFNHCAESRLALPKPKNKEKYEQEVSVKLIFCIVQNGRKNVASETKDAHTNVIILNGNRCDNNNRSIVEQSIVVPLTNIRHWDRKAQEEKRI